MANGRWSDSVCHFCFQHALRLAGLLPGWNLRLNARTCEWVEHRQ
jgi:hypothetical protein